MSWAEPKGLDRGTQAAGDPGYLHLQRHFHRHIVTRPELAEGDQAASRSEVPLVTSMLSMPAPG